jgi:hypothetical protein
VELRELREVVIQEIVQVELAELLHTLETVELQHQTLAMEIRAEAEELVVVEIVEQRQ